jgi:hypothetical protein
LVFVDVEIVENHVQVVIGKGFDNSLRKRRRLTEVGRCLDLSHHLPAGDLRSR